MLVSLSAHDTHVLSLERVKKQIFSIFEPKNTAASARSSFLPRNSKSNLLIYSKKTQKSFELIRTRMVDEVVEVVPPRRPVGKR